MDRRRGLTLFFGLTLAGAALDLLSKWWVFGFLGMEPGDSRPVAGEYLKITPVINYGGPLGLFGGQATVLGILSAAAVAAIVMMVVIYPMRTMYRAALGLFMGGAVGNLYDRIVLKGVRDFIDADIFIQRIIVPRWYIFNLADAFICIGVALFIAAEFQAARRARQAAA